MQHYCTAPAICSVLGHLLTSPHCLFCYWGFFVHLEDKLQVLGCISASFVRSQMNKTMITSMHLMHRFTNESEAIWRSNLHQWQVQVTSAWVKVVSKLWQFSWQGVTLASRVTSLCHVIFASDLRSCPRHQKPILAIWMHTIFFVEKQYNTTPWNDIFISKQKGLDNRILIMLAHPNLIRNFFNFP